MNYLPELRVGEPLSHGGLTVFPLFNLAQAPLEYQLADEAIGAGTLTVEELSEGGSVPTLMVTNQGDRRVLFLEGESLRGAKQNRVLNTSVLVAAHSKTPIPVSCVEQGRWRYRTRNFEHDGTHCSPSLRAVLKSSSSDSLKAGRGHTSDQMGVWNKVARQMMSLGVASATGAMSDTYDTYKSNMEDYRARLPYVEGATGLAVAVGPKLVALDVFDKPATCQKVWERLLSGLVMDALETRAAGTAPGSSEVKGWIDGLRTAAWDPAPAVGEGQEFRTEAVPPSVGSSLMFGEAVVHGSVVVNA